MKIKKLLTSTLAAALTVSAITANAFAADNLLSGDLNLGTGWGGEFLDASNFADVSEGDVVTVEYVINNEADYHLVQIANGCDGWPTLACSNKAVNNQADDEFKNQDDGFAVVSVDGSVSYTLNADDVSTIQLFGMVLRGYDITIKSVTIGAPAASEPEVTEAKATEPETTEAEATEPEVTEAKATEPATEATKDTNAAKTDKNNADTGVESVSAVAGLAIISVLGVIVAKKRNR